MSGDRQISKPMINGRCDANVPMQRMADANGYIFLFYNSIPILLILPILDQGGGATFVGALGARAPTVLPRTKRKRNNF